MRRKQRQREKELVKKRKEEAELRSYKTLHEDVDMFSNFDIEASVDATAANAFEEDFM